MKRKGLTWLCFVLLLCGEQSTAQVGITTAATTKLGTILTTITTRVGTSVAATTRIETTPGVDITRIEPTTATTAKVETTRAADTTRTGTTASATTGYRTTSGTVVNTENNCGVPINWNAWNYGSIQFPLAQDQYSSGLQCEWSIQVPPDMRIKISFDSVDIENSLYCECDYLEVVNTYGYSVKKFCGRQSQTSEVYFDTFLKLRFISDESIEGHGFSLRFFFKATFQATSPISWYNGYSDNTYTTTTTPITTTKAATIAAVPKNITNVPMTASTANTPTGPKNITIPPVNATTANTPTGPKNITVTPMTNNTANTSTGPKNTSTVPMTATTANTPTGTKNITVTSMTNNTANTPTGPQNISTAPMTATTANTPTSPKNITTAPKTTIPTGTTAV